MLLDPILAVTRTRVAALHQKAADVERQAAKAQPPPPFPARGPTVGIIAEIKRRSPSQGDIRPDLDPRAHAVQYARGGAVAISVLTDEVHFGGSITDPADVSPAVRLPTLRKDFIIDELQLLEAVAAGGPHELGLSTLVEVHVERELEAALAATPTAIGVNARDLDTFKIDRPAAERLIARVPAAVLTVAESGLERREDIERVATAGADLALVGTSVARQDDPENAVRALTGVMRHSRA